MKDLDNNCLPTQRSQPQMWGGSPVSLLTLRTAASSAGVAGKQPGSWVAYFLPQDLKRQLFLLLCVGVLSVLSYYLVTRFVATTVIVQGKSMIPTLQDGDRFILNRWSYVYRSPRRGDLVVVKDPGHQDYAVKRIVGMPCESLYFKRGSVLVNGKYLLEPYLASGTQTFLPDTREKLLVVGQDRYYVLGDNRGNSEDSRYYGAVHRSQIIGSISR